MKAKAQPKGRLIQFADLKRRHELAEANCAGTFRVKIGELRKGDAVLCQNPETGEFSIALCNKIDDDGPEIIGKAGSDITYVCWGRIVGIEDVTEF